MTAMVEAFLKHRILTWRARRAVASLPGLERSVFESVQGSRDQILAQQTRLVSRKPGVSDRRIGKAFWRRVGFATIAAGQLHADAVPQGSIKPVIRDRSRRAAGASTPAA